MGEELETIKYAGMTIKVYQDQTPSDPYTGGARRMVSITPN